MSTTFLILAAGSSKRFGTDKLSHPIAGLTLPERAVRFAIQNGAKRICITVSRDSIRSNGRGFYHPIVEACRKLYPGLEVELQDPTMYGPGAAVMAWNQKILEDFIVLFGDNYYDGKINTPWIWSPHETGFTYINHDVPDPRALQLSYVTPEGGYIVEKPHSHVTGKFFAGIAHFPTRVWEQLPALTKSARGEYEITDMLNLLPHRFSYSISSLDFRWGELTYQADVKRLEKLAEDERG